MKAFKRFTFDAAHKLPDWPEIHGHTWRVEVWVEGDAKDGYVIRESDFTKAAEVMKGRLDHRFLNDVMDVPTQENIARFVMEQFSVPLTKVVVWRDSCQMGVEL